MRFTIRTSKCWGSVSRTGGHIVLALFILWASAAEAQVSVSGSLAGAPTRPFDIAADPDSGLLFVSGFIGNLVEVYEMDTGAFVTSIPVGTGPRWIELSHDGSLLIVPNLLDATFSLIDTATLTVSLTVPTQHFPTQVLVSQTGPAVAWLLSAGTGPSDLRGVDPVTGSISGPTTLPFYRLNTRAAITPDGGTALVPHPDFTATAQDLSIVDMAGPSVVATLTVGDLPEHVVISGDGSTAFVSNTSSSTISVIDIPSRTVIGSFATDLTPFTLALFDNDRRLMVSCPASASLQIFDLTTLPASPVLEATIQAFGLTTTVPGQSMLPLEYAGIMLVSGPLTDEIYVLDIDPASPTYATKLQTLTAGSFPTSIVADPARGLAWVVNWIGNTASVLSIPQSSNPGLGGAIPTVAIELETILTDASLSGSGHRQVERAIEFLVGEDGGGGALAALENGDLDGALQMLAQTISALETAALHGAPIDDIVIALAESAALEAHAYVDAVAETVSPSNRQIQKAHRALEMGDAWLAAGRAHTAISSYRQAVIAADGAG